MRLLIAKGVGFTEEMLAAIRGLGLEPCRLPGEETETYDLDFSDVDAVICYRFFCHNDIARFPKLKYIHTTSHGIDHMPLDFIRAHGITLCDARGVYGVPMAEFALGAVLALYKEMPAYYEKQLSRVWRFPERVRELGGRQVTLLGAGSVGRSAQNAFPPWAAAAWGSAATRCRAPRASASSGPSASWIRCCRRRTSCW